METQQMHNHKDFKVFIGGLSQRVTTEILKSSFLPFGEIIEANIIRERNTQKSKGYGFLTFKTKEAYERALKERVVIDGLVSDVKPMKSKTNLNAEKYIDKHLKIFVGGIHPQVKSKELKHYFCKFGEIQESRILYDRQTRISRGFGFILFKHPSSLKKVLAKTHHIRGRKVDCKRFSDNSQQNYPKLDFNQNLDENSSTSLEKKIPEKLLENFILPKNLEENKNYPKNYTEALLNNFSFPTKFSNEFYGSSSSSKKSQHYSPNISSETSAGINLRKDLPIIKPTPSFMQPNNELFETALKKEEKRLELIKFINEESTPHVFNFIDELKNNFDLNLDYPMHAFEFRQNYDLLNNRIAIF